MNPDNGKLLFDMINMFNQGLADQARPAAADARRKYREELEDVANDLKSAATELAIDSRYYTEDARLEIEQNIVQIHNKLAAFERLFRKEGQ